MGQYAPVSDPIAGLSRYRGVRAAVVGASGFIGRWVARLLYQQGAQVALVVRDRRTAGAVLARWGVAGDLFEADALQTGSVKRALQAANPAITFNLAGYGVDPSERHEGTAFRVNAWLVEELCEAAAAVSDPSWLGQRLVHVGSALEYGAVAGDLSEEGEARPTTLYGRSKLAGTLALQRSCAVLGIPGLTARLFTVYGPGEHSGRLLPSLVETATTRNPLPLTAGRQERDFTYVEDVAEGLLRLGLLPVAPELAGTVVNLATGHKTLVRTFAQTAADVLDIPSHLLRFGDVPTRPEEMRHAPVNVGRLRRLSGWVPATSIADGVRRTAAWGASAVQPHLNTACTVLPIEAS